MEKEIMESNEVFIHSTIKYMESSITHQNAPASTEELHLYGFIPLPHPHLTSVSISSLPHSILCRPSSFKYISERA
jgi:hypothetical protein